MAASSQYEVSSTYARGFSKAVKDLALRKGLEPKLTPLAKQFLDDPGGNRWWPSAAVEQCTELIDELYPDPTLLDVGYRTISSTVGPILLPLVKVSLTLFGVSPATLLKRTTELSSSSLRGVDSTFLSSSATEGVLTLLYPKQIPAGYAPLWQGALRWICETADAKNPKIELISHTGQTLEFKVSWGQPPA